MTDAVIWGHFRLQHFLLKSKSEYIQKKLARGRATRFDQPRRMKLFDNHADARVMDAPSPEKIAALRAEIAAIRAQIADLPEEIRDMDLRIDLLGPAPVPKGQRKKTQQRLAE